MTKNSLSPERHQELKNFCDSIQITMDDYTDLDIAFTHRSYINESADETQTHNERIEFLGDAVLELVISEHLYLTYPERAEGELTSFRAATVKTETLAAIARKHSYGKYLKMSKGEKSTGGEDKDYLLANTFEAVLGAIYLHHDLEYCKNFLAKILIPEICKIVEKRLDIDPKTKFQEISQSVYKATPKYELIKEEGPDHNKIFTMGVYINDKQYGIGTGMSKQKAEEKAAEKAMSIVTKDIKAKASKENKMGA